MNELICEMCGSNDIVKQDGLYVCQSCGTKYSVEEARKLMQGERVEVEGTVRIDTSSELDNLYEIARRAKDTDNDENALKYYDQILVKDSKSWEAQFYVVYFRAKICKIAEIGIEANNIKNSIIPILELVKNNVDDDEQEEVLREIYEKCLSISHMLLTGANNWYFNINYKIQSRYKQKYRNYTYPIAFIMYNLGDGFNNIFGKQYRGFSINAWKEGIQLHRQYFAGSDKKRSNEILKNYAEKINQYDPTYKLPKTTGCYIATSVYGSYNCPEVWTLRRFRDKTLEQSVFGRAFIKCYYATSPALVKYFGDKKIFNKLFKPVLDKFVKKLNKNGVKSSFYVDKLY